MNESPTRFGIIGLGYVGLPLAMEASGAGIEVLGFDVSPAVVQGLNEGRSHVEDVASELVRSAVDNQRFTATGDMARLSECDAISICVPTPLSKSRDPDMSYILAASQAVRDALRPGQLIVLESTTYPGTTRDFVLPILEESGLKVGVDVHLCFSPERVDPGNPTWHTSNTPKVMGGITADCTERAQALYGRFIDTIVPVSSPEAAELTKILENTFRAVNIGLVNELALVADRLGVDVWEVIDAAATKPFGFMKFTPGPGLGGHCIPIDPHYLAWRMKELDYRTRFIELASEINHEMPFFVVDKVRGALNRVSKAVNGSRVLVLGVAYKPDIQDVRESPAIDVIRLLARDGAEVEYHDPFVAQLKIDGEVIQSVGISSDTLPDYDVCVIITNHSEIDYGDVASAARCIVDARNATRGVIAPGERPDPQGWIVKISP
jgi:UDP-N-acetyl-D-glucosamine dehydrogenase